MKQIYYLYKKDDGSIGRLVKFENNLFYGYENGEWVEMPGLIKIQFEVTNYEEISKQEAEKLMKGQLKK